MELKYKPDFEAVQNRWDALYAHELIDRPVTTIIVPKNLANPVKPPQYLSFLHDGIEESLDWFDTYLENTWFLGDALPCYRPEAGADMFAAFLGAPMSFDFSGYPERWPDAWSRPIVKNWPDVFPLKVQEDNELWQKMLHALQRTAERGAGRYIIASADLHSNLDALVALRGSSQMIFDMVDTPELVERAMWDARQAYRYISDRFFELSLADEWGSLRGPYCKGKFNMIACDVAAFISPELFRKFVMPAIEEEAAYLNHSMFHFDGLDMVKFMDDVLAVKAIDAINWVPGVQTGGKRFAEWTDFFHKVQKAGKIMQIYNVTADEVKMLSKELRPELVYYSVNDVQSREEAEALLKWLERNA